jgi:hypothetical protein
MQIRVMRLKIVFAVFLFLSFHSNGQELKKKLLGSFEGTIPSYAIDFQGEVLQVPVAPIRIDLQAAQKAILILNGQSKQGNYKILAEDKTSITLECLFVGDDIPEILILFKKEKRLERKGVYPQPDVFLKKIN